MYNSLLWAIIVTSVLVMVKANQEHPYLLFANRELLQQVNLDGSGQKVLRNVSGTNAVAIDFDIRRGYMFWSDVAESKIYRASIDGNNITELVTTGLSVPEGLAWDWVNEKLYWTEAGGNEVEVYDPASGLRMTLISTGEETIPRGIAVDPTTRHLYWTDWGTVAKIEKASMDGKDRTVLIDTQLVWPNAITIDYETKTLYWADASLNKIKSSNTNGLFRTVITESIPHPFAMTVFENQLYWSDWFYDLIVTTEISNPSNVSSVITEVLPNDPMGVQVVTEQRQPQALNPCAVFNGGCSHLCLLSAVTPSGFFCACPDGTPDNTCMTIKATGGQPTVSVTPTVYQGTHNVALGSVVQLYCTASSSPGTAPTITWVKDSSPLYSDPAHIRIRTSTDDSTGESSSVLTVDYFTTQDNGDYLCRASDGGGTMDSTVMSLTALDPASAAVTDILEVPVQPSDREGVWRVTVLPAIAAESDAINDNRTVVPIGQTTFPSSAYQLLRCIASHNGSGTTQPTVVWVKDGVEVTVDGTKITETSVPYSPGNGLQSDLTINDFQESDTGVYQCIFTNLDNDMELVTSIPFRLDAGTNYVLRGLSPETIIIDPPEKLVIEVETAGAYSLIEWEKNRRTAGFNNPNFPGDVRIFPNFFEMHVMDPTDEVDLGNYDVTLQGAVGNYLIEFTVIPYVAPTTPEVSHPITVTILEGGSVNISCTSIGNPLPTFSWKIKGMDVYFSQSDITVDLRTSGGTVNETFVFTPGSTTSTLHIVGAEYPSNSGDYECIATNSHNGVDSTNSSTITLDIQDDPISADVVAIGTSVAVLVVLLVIAGSVFAILFYWWHYQRPRKILVLDNVTVAGYMDGNNSAYGYSEELVSIR